MHCGMHGLGPALCCSVLALSELLLTNSTLPGLLFVQRAARDYWGATKSITKNTWDQVGLLRCAVTCCAVLRCKCYA